VRRPRRWSYDLFDDRDVVSVGALLEPPPLLRPRIFVANRELHPAMAVLFGSVLRRPKFLQLLVRRPRPTLCKDARHTPKITNIAKHTSKITAEARYTPTISKSASHTPKISLTARHTPKISKKAEFNVC